MPRAPLDPGKLRTQFSVRWLGPDTGIGVGFIVDNRSSPQQRESLRLRAEGRIREPVFCFNYVLRGEGALTSWDGETRPLRPGVFFYFDQSRPYRLRHHDADFSECYVAIHHSIYEMLVRAGALPAESLWREIGIHESLIAGFIQLRRDLDDPRMRNAQLLRNTIALLELVHDTTADGRNEAIRHAKVMLGADLERQVSMVAIARELCMSYSYFHRVFRAATGQSPKEYRLRLRIEAACRMLQSLTPKQVASNLGYDSVHFFSRQFKRYTGASPRMFAQRLDRWRPRL